MPHGMPSQRPLSICKRLKFEIQYFHGSGNCGNSGGGEENFSGGKENRRGIK